MRTDPTGDVPCFRVLRRCLRRSRPAALFLLLVLLLAPGLAGVSGLQPSGGGSTEAGGGAGEGSPAVPASRQADEIAVITLDGAIDRWTSISVRRRIEEAERGGVDAIVIEVDSPGGEVGAVLEISNAIKGSSIDNTVAWINPDAYSGGAIVALACREMVTGDPASFGDAFPITLSPMGVRGLSADERTKILPPLLTDVVDSARRSGYDEYLVQAIVVDGIELWGVRDTETGRLLFINENEYRMVFDGAPPRGKPALTAVPEGRRASGMSGPGGGADGRGPGGESAAGEPPGADGDAGAAAAGRGSESDASAAEEGEGGGAAGDVASPAAGDGTGPDAGPGYEPPSESVADVAGQIRQGLENERTRPEITPEMAGRFVDPFYATDGSGPIVMRRSELLRFGLSSGTVENDEELLAFFGGRNLYRSGASWSEHLARFLSGWLVRGILIVILILGLFVEMTTAGTGVGGAAALGALAGLIVPQFIVNMAGWWEVLAIVGGLGLIALEIFVVPGFGIFGVGGLVALFVGLVGTFIPNGPSYPGLDPGGQGLVTGVATVLLSSVTAAIGGYFIVRNAERVPIFDRLILKDPARGEDESVVAAMRTPEPEPCEGDRGTAMTPLRPSGRIMVNGRPYDAVAERGFIEDDAGVEITGRRGFAFVVREASDEPRSEGEA